MMHPTPTGGTRAQVVNSVGNLVYLFLPLFLTRRLGYSSSVAGTLILIFSVAFIPGSLLAGGAVALHWGCRDHAFSLLSPLLTFVYSRHTFSLPLQPEALFVVSTLVWTAGEILQAANVNIDH
ncbi:MAG: hypothetical protein ACLFO1_10485 [Spirochaetaceae bacterium]